MTFAASKCLRKATARAKSDVANKLISMLLHDVSRQVTNRLGLAVTANDYANAVESAFGNDCCYCGHPLEKDRCAVEHLEGMNRFRVGLHIPGNVVVACKRCNGEKRRDDQLKNLVLAPNGWGSFLAHIGDACNSQCRGCIYWGNRWPDASERRNSLIKNTSRILKFQLKYPQFSETASLAKNLLPPILDRIYRECQEFAVFKIKSEVDLISDQLFASLPEKLKNPPSL